MDKKTYDIIIVGGGIMGSAAAYYLMNADNNLRLAVVEMDPAYTRASTTLSMTNARIQFSLKENIQISQYAFEMLERFEEEMAVGDEKPNISCRRERTRFHTDKNSRNATEKAVALHKILGCHPD